MCYKRVPMRTLYKLLFIIVLLSVTLSVDAQKKRLLGDFKIGANFSEMDIAGANKYKVPRVGFHFGGSLSYRMFSNTYIQGGFYLTKKGLKQHDTEIIPGNDESIGEYIENDLKMTLDVNYVQIPVMLGFEIPLSNSFSINLYGGAYGGYAFKGYIVPRRGTITYWTAGQKEVAVYDDDDIDIFDSRRIKRFDYGMIGSVGLVYDIYSLTFNYEHGLYDIADINSFADANGVKRALKNRNMSIALGFRF